MTEAEQNDESTAFESVEPYEAPEVERSRTIHTTLGARVLRAQDMVSGRQVQALLRHAA